MKRSHNYGLVPHNNEKPPYNYSNIFLGKPNNDFLSQKNDTLWESFSVSIIIKNLLLWDGSLLLVSFSLLWDVK